MENTEPIPENNVQRVPAWIRTILILPSFAATIWLIIYWDGVYGYIADVQISWFDGYYVILTGLITLIAYLIILIVCLLPALALIKFIAIFFREKEKAPEQAPMSSRSTYK